MVACKTVQIEDVVFTTKNVVGTGGTKLRFAHQPYIEYDFDPSRSPWVHDIPDLDPQILRQVEAFLIDHARRRREGVLAAGAAVPRRNTLGARGKHADPLPAKSTRQTFTAGPAEITVEITYPNADHPN